MNTYQFSYETVDAEKTKTIVADSYKHAIEKACIYLEDLNDNLDLLGLDDWEDVQEECDINEIYLSDLNEIEE